MLYTDYTQKLLNLQNGLITKITSSKYLTVIDIELPVSAHSCPRCNHSTLYIHDNRQQLIHDIPAFVSPVILNYHRRRYRCLHCGKCFSERHTFAPKYYLMTKRLVAHIP